MNRLILDHLRRWGWLWLLIGVANGFMAGAILDEGRWIQGVTVPLLLWIGALQLNFDMVRGISRVQATLPLTTRQIGRAWWIYSVALPALLLATTTALAAMIYSTHTGKPVALNAWLLNTISNTLLLGALFQLIIGEQPGMPQNLLGWLRRILSVGLLMAMFFSTFAFEGSWEIVVFLAALVITAAGWFRAEQMVVQRATFRPGIQSGKNNSGKNSAPAGFGGLPFLGQTLALRLGYLTLAAIVWFVVMRLMMHGTAKMSPQQFLSAAMPSFTSFGFFALFMFVLMPLIMQLRHLRTLPISTTTLAAMLTLIPCLPIGLVALGWSALNGNGFQSPTGFTAYAAVFSIAAPMLVWQGLRTGSYILIFSLVSGIGISGVFFQHLEINPAIIALISIAVMGASFEMTRRLLQSSSKAYRVLPTMSNSWGQWR